MHSRLLKKLWFWSKLACNRQIYLADSLNQPNKFSGYKSNVSSGSSVNYQFGSLLFLFYFLSFFSCTPETITPPIELEKGFKNGVFITNEGSFTNGNASVTFYDPIEKTVQEKIFETANNQALGDVLQSMTLIDDKAYLVVNNSQKVEVVQLNDFSLIGTIGGLISPRYLTPINETTAYVSDIFGAAISVVDLNTQKETSKIPFGSASEGMLKVGTEMFVAQPSLSINTKKSSNQLFIINTVTNQVTDSIQVGYSPYYLALDRNNKLWAICNGDFGNKEKLGGLYKINPVTKEVELALPFSDDAVSFFPRVAMNEDKSQLYFLKLDIFKLSIEATALPTTPIIKADGRDIFGLGVDPATGHIYIGDSGNFQQKGTVTIHDATGKELSAFKAGVGINGFYFN